MAKTKTEKTAAGDEIEITQNTGLPDEGTHLEDEDRLTDDPLGDYQRRVQHPEDESEDVPEEDLAHDE